MMQDQFKGRLEKARDKHMYMQITDKLLDTKRLKERWVQKMYTCIENYDIDSGFSSRMIMTISRLRTGIRTILNMISALIEIPRWR